MVNFMGKTDDINTSADKPELLERSMTSKVAKPMPRHIYRHSDLLPLTGAMKTIEQFERRLRISIECDVESFSPLAAADDVPQPLRRYYSKVVKKLMAAKKCLQPLLAECDGWALARRIESSLGRLELTEEDLSRLRHVNNRLLELEKSLKQMTDGMRERLEGLNPPGVQWDEWDMVEINLCLSIGTDSERPAYDPDVWAEEGLMESVEIRVQISVFWEADEEERWGLDDGQDHSEFGECGGYPLRQGYLFHQLYDHADVGLWGMLHLQSLWIEIIPHRSGDFQI